MGGEMSGIPSKFCNVVKHFRLQTQSAYSVCVGFLLQCRNTQVCELIQHRICVSSIELNCDGFFQISLLQLAEYSRVTGQPWCF